MNSKHKVIFWDSCWYSVF